MSANLRGAVRPSKEVSKPYPLGVTWDGHGVNVAVFSEHATSISLCLFDDSCAETTRAELSRRTNHVWHNYFDGIGPGQLYGFRADGPYCPEEGHRFNPHKLLIDPYARAIHGTLDWNGPVRGYDRDFARGDLSIDPRDSASHVPKSVVVDTQFNWGDDRPPDVPWSDTVIYETHVAGLTRLHPLVPEYLRGTYLGLCQPPVLAHLKGLGVTAIELMPIHAFLDEEQLTRRGLRNYWGYNTIGFFAPAGRFAQGGTRGAQVTEFKQMVQTLHADGFEVILDVVYNHTAEGGPFGPTIAFRGLDNATYYRLRPGHPRYYLDVTGTGNTLNAHHPQVLQLIMDSLRYWVEEMHVDGFRFDLTPALARDPHDVDPRGAFLRAIHQDPVLAPVKLIAEPWDLGEGGYQVGNFPIRWSEWNDRFRDATRAFWRGDAGRGAEIGYRLTGSSDLFRAAGRTPRASINFVTAHDGFTLEDLVSFQRKHNEANGEENRDGSDHNFSSNHGQEGPSFDPAIRARRDQQKRNLMATLFLAQGVPMLCGGDELGRTQRGNNNAYCQDNEIGWYSWQDSEIERLFLSFCRRLSVLRGEYRVLRRATFFDGLELLHGTRDLTWWRPDGSEMLDADWRSPHLRVLVVQLADTVGDDDPDERADQLVMILNAGQHTVDVRMPPTSIREGDTWLLLLDTATWESPQGVLHAGGDCARVAEHSMRLYCRADTADAADAG
ncbi:MAG: glycogen debranching protein GlgX [Thermomicrobiales bacterium]